MIKDASYGIVPLTLVDGIWKVLLIYHKNGNHWGFPKGHKDGDETDFEAACRELLEETGVQVHTCLRDDPFVEKFRFRRKGSWVEKTVSYFPAIVTGEIVIQVEEIRDAGWFSFPDALSRLTFDEARSICNQAQQLLQL
ncbi:MAG: NUDIX domain-containing protein [Chlamydiia bacterium]